MNKKVSKRSQVQYQSKSARNERSAKNMVRLRAISSNPIQYSTEKTEKSSIKLKEEITNQKPSLERNPFKESIYEEKNTLLKMVNQLATLYEMKQKKS